MSARTRDRRRGTPGADPAPRTVSRLLPWLALAGLVAGAAWWLARPAEPPPAAPAPDPAEQLGLVEANAEAARLLGEGRAVESLPYFRRQLELLHPAVWAAHKDFATALHDAALESGPEGPATRSSFERKALIDQSLRELDIAASLTAVPKERAALLLDRAHTLWWWGLPWDAVETLERAEALTGPTSEPARRARLMRAVMEQPTAPGAAAALGDDGPG